MEISKVLDAAFEYLEENMVPGMNDLQEIAFFAIKETVVEEAQPLMEAVMKNPLYRAIAAIDKNGDVNTERLCNRVRKAIERKGGAEFDVPLYGKIRFTPEDIDKIEAKLNGGGGNEGYQIAGRAY
jgi:hypothetical protein